MKLVRNLLLRLLGLKGFLSLISRTYLFLVSRGYLRKLYPELFQLEKIIKPGFTCIDIGANLGYYSYFLSKYSGKGGKVLSVEPVSLFAEIWKKNTARTGINNLTLLPFALGAENKPIKMGMPKKDGVLHHGMTKIASTANEDYVEYFEVEMRIPDELFANETKIDFIKCDVEGYERYVFGNLQKTIDKHLPLIQCELGGEENRKIVIDLLESNYAYQSCILQEGTFTKASASDKLNWPNDFYFLPANYKL